MDKITDKNEKRFFLIICSLSAIISLLYIWNGILEQFYIATYIFIALHILFIPVVLYFKRKGFTIYCMIYSIILIFIIAFHKTIYIII